MPQRIDKLAKSRTANWFQLQCWSKCGDEGRSMVGQEWHRWDQTDLRGLLRVLHAPRAVLHCGSPTEHWLFYQSLCRGSNWWDTVEKPNKQTWVSERKCRKGRVEVQEVKALWPAVLSSATGQLITSSCAAHWKCCTAFSTRDAELPAHEGMDRGRTAGEA